ncbi:hypothetical protein KIN20_019494 [Parelaphostrongylus tenuis]|uniref:Uncharacterized protein n=1 Tax=Parelaphostrongylus tenuis TaxID=148309 RepID=A0AAD5MPL7_PARTN|nr:hypothetical protein KIN20_019494 [Parelaphostrongylus tenuis]
MRKSSEETSCESCRRVKILQERLKAEWNGNHSSSIEAKKYEYSMLLLTCPAKEARANRNVFDAGGLAVGQEVGAGESKKPKRRI